MLNYNHLYYFHVAALEGSVGAAADKLGVTQPTVSEQIRSLERTLRVGLFERMPSGLKLTDVGRLAFEHTSVMFRAGERLVQSLGHGPQNVPRTLRVGLSTAVARSTTTDFLMPLLALEGCVPTISSADSAQLLRELRGNELDLVLCETEPPVEMRQGLELQPIAQTILVAVAPPNIQPAEDWHDVGLVQYRPTSSYRWDVEAFLDANGYRPRIAAEADDSLFLVEAAARGGFVTVVPRSVARDAISTGRLRVLARVESMHASVNALYQDGETAELARKAVQVLVDHVRAQVEA
ncbi:MAG: transcriptional regulator, LysR family [Myxococcales bacterium]|nr:transcriptional regulator, LysR family [Myxococcales bacterium]